jgi:phosphoglycolate phosphatase-like HAD superfamily hydrolase
LAEKFGKERMKLAIFDVDGTLTKTNEVDTKCFLEAFVDSHQITEIDTNWTRYKHATDSAITWEIVNEKLNREPNEQDFSAFKTNFVFRLKEYLTKSEMLFTEIPSAREMLQRLQNERNWAIAIATGCYYESARIKLEAAKISIENYPYGTADDAMSREDILRTAIKKSLQHYRQSGFDKIVSIGDAVWDIKTAKNLNVSFLGIAKGKRAELLRENGAKYIVKDFTDYGKFFKFLNEA